jgi:hypothetical protein
MQSKANKPLRWKSRWCYFMYVASQAGTVREPREFRCEWGGHERLHCTLSQNMRPPCNTIRIHSALHNWRLLEYNRNKRSTHAQ